MFPKNFQGRFIYSAWEIYLAMAFLFLKNKPESLFNKPKA